LPYVGSDIGLVVTAQQRPELFLAVEREVLNFSRRSLSGFTPQQLAAIAWGFVAAEMTAPRLFYAIQNEARSQPVLDDLLQKAGLLQHLRQRGILAAGVPVGLNGGWSQGMVPPQGAATSQYLAHSGQGNGGGGFPVLNSAPPSRPSQHPANNYGASLQGSVLPTPTAAQMQYLSQLHPSMVPFSSQVHQPPLQIHGLHSAQALANTTVQHHSMVGTGSGASTATSSTSQPRYCDVSNRYHALYTYGESVSFFCPEAGSVVEFFRGDRFGIFGRPDVVIAAEEHKKEMERKQREVLGDTDSEWSCPLCIEPMDDTDISFLPCPCGYQVQQNLALISHELGLRAWNGRSAVCAITGLSRQRLELARLVEQSTKKKIFKRKRFQTKRKRKEKSIQAGKRE
jgi:hypothetical protein